MTQSLSVMLSDLSSSSSFVEYYDDKFSLDSPFSKISLPKMLSSESLSLFFIFSQILVSSSEKLVLMFGLITRSISPFEDLIEFISYPRPRVVRFTKPRRFLQFSESQVSSKLTVIFPGRHTTL